MQPTHHASANVTGRAHRAQHICMHAARNMLTYKARGLVYGRTWVGNGRRGRRVRSGVVYSRELSVWSRVYSSTARFTRAFGCCRELPGTECQEKSGAFVPSSHEARGVAVIGGDFSSSFERTCDPRTTVSECLGILQHAVRFAEQQSKCAMAR